MEAGAKRGTRAVIIAVGVRARGLPAVGRLDWGGAPGGGGGGPAVAAGANGGHTRHSGGGKEYIKAGGYSGGLWQLNGDAGAVQG